MDTAYGQAKAGRPARTYSSYVRIRDVAQKTCQRRWLIGRSGERGSGISVLAARHDDDDDELGVVLPLCRNAVGVFDGLRQGNSLFSYLLVNTATVSFLRIISFNICLFISIFVTTVILNSTTRFFSISFLFWGGEVSVTNVQNMNIIEKMFVLQLRYSVHFWTNILRNSN